MGIIVGIPVSDASARMWMDGWMEGVRNSPDAREVSGAFQRGAQSARFDVFYKAHAPHVLPRKSIEVVDFAHGERSKPRGRDARFWGSDLDHSIETFQHGEIWEFSLALRTPCVRASGEREMMMMKITRAHI
jgi:hypothetical protein